MPRTTTNRKFKRLFSAADLHGSEIVYRKFLAAAKFYEADALRIGGDLTAKRIAPIVQQRDGRLTAREHLDDLSAIAISSLTLIGRVLGTAFVMTIIQRRRQSRLGRWRPK